MEPIQKSELKKDKYKDPVKEERKRTHKHRGTQRSRSNPNYTKINKKRTQKKSCAAKNYCQGGEDVLCEVQQLKNAENKTAT